MAGLLQHLQLDPQAAQWWLTLRALRRQLTLRPALREVVWERLGAPGARLLGPISAARRCLAALGWQVGPAGPFHRTGDVPLHAWALDDNCFDHELRRSIRRAMMGLVPLRRKDLTGIQAGHVFVTATTTLTRQYRGRLWRQQLTPAWDALGGPPTAMQAGTLGTILAGAVYTAREVSKWDPTVSADTCPWCNEEPETRCHLWCRCPAWSCHRPPGWVSEVYQDTLPACTLECGIAMEPAYMQRWRAALLALPEPDLADNSCEVVYTDGACTRQECAEIRRAGCGVFYADGHPANRSYPLPGLSQSAARAELHAVAVAVSQCHVAQLLICTDCQFVILGIQMLRLPHPPIDTWRHADLWHRLQEVLQTRHCQLETKKIPAHCCEEDVARGKLTREDWKGNAAADALAVAGAGMHQIPAEEVQHFQQLIRTTAWRQAVMHNILSARWSRLSKAQAREAPICDEEAVPDADSDVAAGAASVDAGEPLERPAAQAAPDPWVPPTDASPFAVPPLEAWAYSGKDAAQEWLWDDDVREALHWYFCSLRWGPPQPTGMTVGTSWLELAIDFVAATGMPLTLPGRLRTVARTARDYHRTLLRMHGLLARRLQVSALVPGRKIPLKHLPQWGLQKLVGVAARAALLRPHAVRESIQNAAAYGHHMAALLWEPAWAPEPALWLPAALRPPAPPDPQEPPDEALRLPPGENAAAEPLPAVRRRLRGKQAPVQSLAA